MKIVIAGQGKDQDDQLVRYILRAENKDFKGTIEFYGYTDVFLRFADALLKLPFESKNKAKFSADGIVIGVSLSDSIGGIDFNISIKDSDSNSVEFNDTTIEVQMLHDFAQALKVADFSRKNTIEWSV